MAVCSFDGRNSEEHLIEKLCNLPLPFIAAADLKKFIELCFLIYRALLIEVTKWLQIGYGIREKGRRENVNAKHERCPRKIRSVTRSGNDELYPKG